MARFHVYENKEGRGYLLDVQANLLDELKTRVVVPLMPEGSAPKPAKGLNPVFAVAGEDHVMVTQFLAAVPVSALGSEVASLASDDATIVGALDFLFQGI